MVSYITIVHDGRLLELPEEANVLGLNSGDEVEVSVQLVLHHGMENGTKQESTPQGRAKALRAWADSHSHNTPLLSDDAISRESFYGGRG